MEIKILTSETPGYMNRAKNIVDLYNDSSDWSEELNLKNPESTSIICVEGDKGGVLIDSFCKVDLKCVMFAAFEEKNRRKGYLRACIEFGKKSDLDIVVVELNLHDNTEPWKKLGYKYVGMFSMCLCCTNRKLDFVNYDVTIGAEE